MSTSEAPSSAQVAIDLRAVLSRLLRRLREAGSDTTVTPSQASALARLGKGGLSTVSTLARAEKVKPQSMASTVSALVDLGYVMRSPDPNDGRKQIVGLTQAGWDRLAGQKQAGAAWLEETLATRLGSEDLQTLERAIHLLSGVVE